MNASDAGEVAPRQVRIGTNFGAMVVELSDETPLHRDNFIKLVEEGFYDSLLFHRVMQGFMVQGGDPAGRNAHATQQLGSGGPGYTVPAEFNRGLNHFKGALAAARQPDHVNPDRASSGSQFYVVQGKTYGEEELLGTIGRLNSKRTSADSIHYTAAQVEGYMVQGGTPFLDMEYTVFGMVIEGLEVIDIIAAQPVMRGNRPHQDIRMTMEIIR